MLDIFNNDAFSVVSLTDAINELAFVPGRISKTNLFTATGITTINASIEKRGDRLALVGPTPRGAPGETVNTTKDRKLIPIAVPHFERNDAVMADEVQGVRAFGSETEVETVMGKVAEKVQAHSQDLAATTEFAQLGAIKGTVTYADGSELDLYQTMGVAEPAAVDFNAAALKAAKDDGAFRLWAAGLVRSIAGELGGLPWSGKLRVFCGDNLFDAVLANQEVRDSYKGWTQAQILREGYIEANGESFGAFEFADLIFENYRGQVGATRFVGLDAGHAFPEGVPGLFRTYYAPADYVETVNTQGKRLYAKQYAMQNGKGVNLDVQMNELNICTRPRALRTIAKV